MSKVSKAQQILLSIFGEPKSGFTGVGYPTEHEVVSYWMWILQLEVPVRGNGVNRSIGNTEAVKMIANSLDVQWDNCHPGVQLVNKECVKQKVRDIITKAKGLMNKTKKMDDQGWILDQQKSFSSTVDIRANPEVSHEVTKHSFW